MSNFTFEQKGHRYYLDGKPMTGVTTILGVIAKPALINWAANCAIDYVHDALILKGEYALGCSKEQLEMILAEARKAHTRKRDTAADKGKDIHLHCEIIIRDLIERNGGCVPKELKHDLPQVQAFLDWAVRRNVQFTLCEEKVYSAALFVAGTLDFTCIMDGIKYVGDIKTTSGIYDRTPFAQTAAYQFMLSEMARKTPQEIAGRRIIINLKKEAAFDEDKDVYISEHYDDDIELFMSALTMYRNVGRFEPLHYLSNRK